MRGLEPGSQELPDWRGVFSKESHEWAEKQGFRLEDLFLVRTETGARPVYTFSDTDDMQRTNCGELRFTDGKVWLHIELAPERQTLWGDEKWVDVDMAPSQAHGHLGLRVPDAEHGRAACDFGRVTNVIRGISYQVNN